MFAGVLDITIHIVTAPVFAVITRTLSNVSGKRIQGKSGMPRKKESPAALQARIQRETTAHVKAMIAAMTAYTGKGDRQRYVIFREHKRAIYDLYPGQPDKAQAIVRFALAKSGWIPAP